jgi:glycosyltransferase involved in cell wall biosynthesis
MESKVLIFIPMYNCEKQIVRVLDQFNSKIKKYASEIIIVNNRSTDTGEEVAIKKMEEMEGIKTTLLRNDGNYGLGGSHKVAFDYAIRNGFDNLIVLHGDDQGDINDILPHLEKGEHMHYDCLLGARFHSQSKLQGYSWFRTFGNRVYNLLFSIGARYKIYDLGSGLNCYRISAFKEKYYQKFPDDLTFNYCMILGSIYKRQSIKFFPLTWREDDQISNVKMVRQALRVLQLLWSYISGSKKFMETDHRKQRIENYSNQVVKGEGEIANEFTNG